MYDFELVVDQITVTQLTTSEPGDEDEVYFLVTGGTTAYQIPINNRVPSESGGSSRQGYENLTKGETSPLIFNLAQFSVDDGGSAGLVIGINEVDLNIGDLLGSIGLVSLGLGITIFSAISGNGPGVLAGLDALGPAAVSLGNALAGSDKQPIGTFSVGVLSQEGKLEAIWLPGVDAAPIPMTASQNDTSYTAMYRSQGNGSDYTFRVSIKSPNTRSSALSYSLVDKDGKNLLDDNTKKEIINLVLVGDAAINGTGNNLDNILTGNEAKNTLDGLAGNDTLYGRGGNDILIGGEGRDSMSGGTGDDTYYVDDPGDKVIERKDDGTDTVNTSINYALSDNVEKLILLEGTNAINGTGNDDSNTITGNSADNVLDGKAGSDTLFGGAGKDTLIGGADSDSLYGNDGNDALYGDAGDDLLVGGAGNDFIDGGNGVNDTVSYENTLVALEPPYGVIVSIDETDHLTPGIYLYSNPFSSTVIGFDPTPGTQIAAGTALDGLGNKDTLRNLENIIGSNLDDVLIGNSAENTIYGLAGNDILVGNAGKDTLDGGDGIDTVSYQFDLNAVSVNLDKGTAIDGSYVTDSLWSIENVVGSNQKDLIIGSNGTNWLYGGGDSDRIEAGGGNDILYGEAGDDLLFGENGNDKLIGGSGADLLNGGTDLLNGGAESDTASYSTALAGTALAGIVASLANPQTNTGDAQGDIYISIENLEGSHYNDTLIGNSQNNHLWGLEGNDYLDGFGGNDILEGGLGNDTYRIDTLAATIIEYFNQGIDIDTVNASINYTLGANLENLNLLEGTAAYNGIGNGLSNTINGNSYDNYIDGGDSNDFLYGYAGSDTILGGNGDDWIVGGQRNDLLTGGSGNDRFVYSSLTDAGDRITDFAVGSDKIVLTDMVNSSGWRSSNLFADGFLMTRQASKGVAVLMIDPDGRGATFGPAPFILLDNVSAAALGNMSNFMV